MPISVISEDCKISFLTKFLDDSAREMTIPLTSGAQRHAAPPCNCYSIFSQVSLFLAAFIEKTERNLYQRCKEHATTKDSAVYNHMMECSELQYLKHSPFP